MKSLRIVSLLLVLLSVTLSGSVSAADLQAGWYANVELVNLYSYDQFGQPFLRAGGYFYDTPSGQYGPFLVTDGPYHVNWQRYVSVPTSAYGVGPSQSLTLPLSFGITLGEQIAYLSISTATDYDPSQMYLNLWRLRSDGTKEVIWTQINGGPTEWWGHVASDTYYEGQFFFTVNVVPEPSAAVFLFTASALLTGMLRRRRWQMRRYSCLGFVVFLSLLITSFVLAGLTPGDIVVVYNRRVPASQAVADYYCAARGIPADNRCEIDWPSNDESITPEQFYDNIQLPLEAFLHEHFHSDEVPIGEDPIKAIVLCYGVPMVIAGGERVGAVDSTLSLLFNTTPWGAEPIGGCAAGYSVGNPYYEAPPESIDCLQRTKIRDFAEFKSSSENDWNRDPINHPPPGFTIVRMLHANHAVAGGPEGGVYMGAKDDTGWHWSAVADKDRGFIIHDVTDISVNDSLHAWVCTAGGTVLRIPQSGATWETIKVGSRVWLGGPSMADSVLSVACTGETGWIVGKNTAGGSHFVRRYNGAIWEAAWGDLPGDCSPRFIAAVDWNHAWVTGESNTYGDGIWYTSNGGGNWTKQYTGDVYRITVRQAGSSFLGWALCDTDHILQTTDGEDWAPLTEPTLPGSWYEADLAVFDSSHAAIACHAAPFLIYDGTSWLTDNSDPSHAKASVAWAGGDAIAANETARAIWTGQGSPGSYTWTEAYHNNLAHWKIAYLVCRLDGYSEPLAGDSNIPLDVEKMIDSSVRSSLAGPPTDGRFVLDYAPGRWFTADFVNCLGVIVGPSNVKYEANPSVFLTHENQVIGYSGGGFYDNTAADNATTWTRPLNNSPWKDGAIGVINHSSGDGYTLRYARFLNPPGGVSPPEAGRLKATISEIHSSRYSTHWLGLHSGDNSVLARSFFMGPSDPTAIINLSGIAWPADHKTYMAVHFPADDPQYPDGIVPDGRTGLSKTIYEARENGISYRLERQQALAAELVHEGCAGVTGNVREPYSGGCPIPQRILTEYANGSTWAESAYMGFPVLGWQEIAVGDPLMAAYATPPTVSIVEPDDQAVVSGAVLVGVSAGSAPVETGIKRLEFWLTNENDIYQSVAVVTEPPFVCAFDSTSVADDTYKLRVVAYENNSQAEAAECTQQLTIANQTALTTISIIQPPQNGAMLSDTVALQAEASNPPAIASAVFRLYGSGGCRQVSASGSPLTGQLDTTTLPDGEYAVIAIASLTDGSICGSLPRQVTVNNEGIVQITDPAADGFLVSNSKDVQIAVTASGPPPVGYVELYLSGEELPEELVGTDSSSPYSVTLDASSLDDGIYTLRAVAFKEGGAQIVNQGLRMIVVTNDHLVCERIVAARKQANQTALAIGPKPTAAGTIDGAFYIEEADRSAGLRVAWLSSVQSGKMATILGTIGNNDTTGEREIVAEQVWLSEGEPVILNPIFLTSQALGGAVLQPEEEPDTNAVTGAYGLYNVGMLVTIVGKVVYVGDDYIYIDDGSGIQDGNEITRPVEVRLNGDPIPDPIDGIQGIKVYVGDFDKPGIGDYAQVTGISSLQHIGSNYAWYLRVRSQADITCPHGYTDADVFPAGIEDLQGNILPVGTEVRLADKCIYENHVDYFCGVDFHGPIACVFNVLAETMVTGDQVNCEPFTTVGTIADDISGLHSITPDAVYLGGSASGAGGGTMGISSLGSTRLFSASSHTGSSSSEGTFKPWPGPTPEEVMASEWFNAIFYSPGSVGWALAQPDGTMVSLIGEFVLSEVGDALYGIKETFDPIPEAPRIYMALSCAAKENIVQAQIDIVNGIITTLADGKRAIIKPEAVYLYTDYKGRPCGPFWLKSAIPDASEWPSKRQVYP